MRIPGINTNMVVLALDLPDNDNFQRSDGTYVDIGYLHSLWSGGEWVGYVGSSTQYLNLDKPKLTVILAAAGISEFPPVPAKPLSIRIVEWGSIAVALLMALMWVATLFIRRASGADNQKRNISPQAHLQRQDARFGESAAPSTAQKGFGRRV